MSRLAGHPIRILVRGRTAVGPGQVVHLSAPAELVHIFDPAPIPVAAMVEDA